MKTTVCLPSCFAVRMMFVIVLRWIGFLCWLMFECFFEIMSEITDKCIEFLLITKLLFNEDTLLITIWSDVYFR